MSRSILRVSGSDARVWLQGLVTNDVEKLASGEGRYAALLSPQGKILFDFFVAADGDALLIDCPADQAAALLKRLSMYKLRASIALADVSHIMLVAAAWGDAPPPVSRAIVFADPRHSGMGWRLIGEAQEFDLIGIEAGKDEAYTALRIACCVPQGGIDFAYSDAFPHEANMDLLNGIDFKKGCYVGQEVVSRVHHRGTARKRIVKVTFSGDAPRPGSIVFAGDLAIGEIGSGAPPFALASLRLDKVEDARLAGTGLVSDDVVIAIAAVAAP